MANQCFVIGDIHGSVSPVKAFYNRNCETINFDGTDTMICLGDFGANFFMNKRDWKMKHNLSKLPFTYFVIRGNHEERASICMAKEPDKWHIETYFDGEVIVENEFPNIKYAMDEPCLYNIAGFTTLTLPGAYSVDKFYRLQSGLGWFPNEQLSEAEMEAGTALCEKMGWKVDLVLSHTCPICFEPTDLFLSFIDQSMVDKSMERYFGSIEYQLDYSAWMWGHYHAFRDYPRNDGKIKIMMSAGGEVVELTQIMGGDIPACI